MHVISEIIMHQAPLARCFAMLINAGLILCSSVALGGGPSPVSGPALDPWTRIDGGELRQLEATPYAQQWRANFRNYLIYRVDEPALRGALLDPAHWNGLLLHLPQPDGTSLVFVLHQDSILSPELQAKYPELRQFKVTRAGASAPAGTAGWGQGFNAQIDYENEIASFDRSHSEFQEYYVVFRRSDYIGSQVPSRCDIGSTPEG
ncbi:MAG: hypothetical protein JNN30_18510 [Rhodanobacteraceae bacterium]|nr:hypothetical protein [Rhodanobacteraceae bacterium]